MKIFLQKPLRYEVEHDIELVTKMSKFILHKKRRFISCVSLRTVTFSDL